MFSFKTIMGLHGTTTNRAHDTHDIWRGGYNILHSIWSPLWISWMSMWRHAHIRKIRFLILKNCSKEIKLRHLLIWPINHDRQVDFNMSKLITNQINTFVFWVMVFFELPTSTSKDQVFNHFIISSMNNKLCHFIIMNIF